MQNEHVPSLSWTSILPFVTLVVLGGCSSTLATGSQPDAATGPDPACVGRACGADCCPGSADPSTCANNAGWVCNDRSACVLPGSSPVCATADAGVDAESGDSSSTPDAAAPLHWYLTCGDPVCRVPSADAGVEDAGTCASGVGAPCSTLGETCGGPSSCNEVQTCLDHDPKAGACPMSSRKFKDNIEYVGPAELERLHDEVLRMRLATYNYKGQYADPNPQHLGFIVEDNPSSLAVDRGHDRVDVYGYLSMVVATMQVQEKEIADLKNQLATARREGATKQRK